ncbi:uncharacterized protein LOC124607059 [Schistocerca americana]|uniref:uncharacterized protein LOC124607059 n=1 Tax=Schistocerca americana TaxID=7009 RepID=UPI001F4F5E69|nr:uncharacterized protein LOC124607059 [Schistocerca americana]XP_049959145.1 uncharacterized protein LOC126475369 [Schistocerca serialis cubense]
MRKSRTTVKPANEVDSKELLMELEKTTNTFARETETIKDSFKESQESKGKLPKSRKRGWQKQIYVGKNTNLPHMKSIKRQSAVGFINMTRHKQNKQVLKRNRKSSSDAAGTKDGYSEIPDSEEEEYVGKMQLKGFEAVEQNLQSTEECSSVREEDCQDCPEYKSSAALFYSNNMMPHPAADIAKVLQSKKNIKTKKNFQFKFNNFRRQNGSVGTILSTEGKVLTCFTRNVEDNWCGVIRPCSVRLSRLSERELMSGGHLVIPSDTHKAGSISASAPRYRQTKMKKSRCDTSVKPAVRVPNEVDKTELHLELEKAASTFASEVKQDSYTPFEAEFENTESLVVSEKDEARKVASINKNCDKKGHMNSSKGDSNVLTSNVVQKNREKTRSGRINRNVSDSQHAHMSTADSEAEEEDWLGWNSRVTPLNTIPGGEIVSVKENDHVEELINWNMKVESDSDMDVEEVFLLTDLVEIKKKYVSTESLSSDSEDEWPGWPEYKPPCTLYYIFKV